MAWKKSPPELIAAFEKAKPSGPSVTARPMFGYPALFLNGNMFAGTYQDKIIVRLGAERTIAGATTANVRTDAGAADEGVRCGAGCRRDESREAACVGGSGVRLCEEAACEEGPLALADRDPSRGHRDRSFRFRLRLLGRADHDPGGEREDRAGYRRKEQHTVPGPARRVVERGERHREHVEDGGAAGDARSGREDVQREPALGAAEQRVEEGAQEARDGPYGERGHRPREHRRDPCL